MISYILIIIIILVSTTSNYTFADNSNSILKDGRKWIFAHTLPTHGDFPDRFYSTQVIGDTIIDGNPSKIMSTTHIKSMHDIKFYAYENSGKLYTITPDGKKYIVLDFSLNLGDHPDQSSIVSAIDEIEIGGILRKRLTINNNSDFTPTYWIEGIGMSNDIIDLNNVGPTIFDHSTLIEVWDGDEKIFTQEQFTPERQYENPYGKTVREDRIWNYEYKNIKNPQKLAPMACTGYHFDGTMIANNKKYAILKNKDGIQVALMRENEGKVYQYLCWDNYDGDSDEIYWIKNINNILRINECPGEILVWDFSCTQGSYYTSIGYNYVNTALDSDNKYDIRIACPTKVIVNDIVNATLNNGKKSIMQLLSYDYGGIDYNGSGDKNYSYDPNNVNKAIDGIGAMTGRLHMPEIKSKEDEFNFFYYILNNVTDKEGNIIFERNDFDNYNPINSLIREDRIWEYYKLFKDVGSDHSWSLTRYKFDGTEERNGKTYHRWCSIDRDYWYEPIGQYPDGSWNWNVQYEDLNECVALLREENGVIYLLPEKDRIGSYEFMNNTFDVKVMDKDDEVVLYDFNLGKGAVSRMFLRDIDEMLLYNYFPDTNIGDVIDVSSDVEITDVFNYEFQNKCYKSFEADNKLLRLLFTDPHDGDFMAIPEKITDEVTLRYVEGVGNVGWGDLINYGSTMHFTAEMITGTCYRELCLNNQYDLEGNITYPGENVTAPRSGVESVKMAAPKLSVNGNSVSATLQGSDLRMTIYSIDGRVMHSVGGMDAVEVAGLPSGIYLVEVNATGNVMKRKVIIL